MHLQIFDHFLEIPLQSWPNFSAFVTIIEKIFPENLQTAQNFFGTGNDRLGIPERKARLIWGVCVGGLGSQWRSWLVKC